MTDLCVLLIDAVNNLPETIQIIYMPGKPEIFLLMKIWIIVNTLIFIGLHTTWMKTQYVYECVPLIHK